MSANTGAKFVSVAVAALILAAATPSFAKSTHLSCEANIRILDSDGDERVIADTVEILVLELQNSMTITGRTEDISIGLTTIPSEMASDIVNKSNDARWSISEKTNFKNVVSRQSIDINKKTGELVYSDMPANGKGDKTTATAICEKVY